MTTYAARNLLLAGVLAALLLALAVGGRGLAFELDCRAVAGTVATTDTGRECVHGRTTP